MTELEQLRKDSEELCRRMMREAESELRWRELADQMIDVLIRIAQFEGREVPQR